MAWSLDTWRLHSGCGRGKGLAWLTQVRRQQVTSSEICLNEPGSSCSWYFLECIVLDNTFSSSWPTWSQSLQTKLSSMTSTAAQSISIARQKYPTTSYKYHSCDHHNSQITGIHRMWGAEYKNVILCKRPRNEPIWHVFVKLALHINSLIIITVNQRRLSRFFRTLFCVDRQCGPWCVLSSQQQHQQ